ncbi:hypothetical protein GN958_ATG18223, partial [Phytophthora infestans]
VRGSVFTETFHQLHVLVLRILVLVTLVTPARLRACFVALSRKSSHAPSIGNASATDTYSFSLFMSAGTLTTAADRPGPARSSSCPPLHPTSSSPTDCSSLSGRSESWRPTPYSLVPVTHRLPSGRHFSGVGVVLGGPHVQNQLQLTHQPAARPSLTLHSAQALRHARILYNRFLCVLLG